MQRGEVKTLAASLNSARDLAPAPIVANAGGALSSTGPTSAPLRLTPPSHRTSARLRWPELHAYDAIFRNELTIQRAQDAFRRAGLLAELSSETPASSRILARVPSARRC
jgi:hypothetical protein